MKYPAAVFLVDIKHLPTIANPPYSRSLIQYIVTSLITMIYSLRIITRIQFNFKMDELFISLCLCFRDILIVYNGF